jgi:hypothetical protein
MMIEPMPKLDSSWRYDTARTYDSFNLKDSTIGDVLGQVNSKAS